MNLFLACEHSCTFKLNVEHCTKLDLQQPNYSFKTLDFTLILSRKSKLWLDFFFQQLLILTLQLLDLGNHLNIFNSSPFPIVDDCHVSCQHYLGKIKLMASYKLGKPLLPPTVTWLAFMFMSQRVRVGSCCSMIYLG